MITICSVVYNDNSTNLFQYMVRSVQKFTPDAKFVIADNGNNNLSSYSDFTIIPNKSQLRGSLQHGDSLNKLISHSTTEYTAIIESDVMVLNHNWWKTTKSLKAAIKVEDLFHVCFMIGRTEILNNIDWRPNGTVNRSYKPYEDVGFRLKTKDFEPVHFVDCKTSQAKIFKHLQSDEFHDKDGNVIAAHFGRGSNLGGKANRTDKGFAPVSEQLAEWKQIAEGLLQ